VSAPYILSKLKACEGLVQGMSYWTYTDLFEEPGPPTAAFQGGFGLMNRDGIRKPAFFAYKYLHALQGDTLHSNDPQTMMAVQRSSVNAVIWDFKQPIQNVSNRPFYTKLRPATPSAPVVFNVTHLKPHARYHVAIHRTGYEANDAYSAYIKMGLPKDLTTGQIAQLSDLTRDRPEREQVVRSDRDGTVSVTIPMRSNDVVLISLTPEQARLN
jgi:xylan 1,4-beta-xylosidase